MSKLQIEYKTSKLYTHQHHRSVYEAAVKAGVVEYNSYRILELVDEMFCAGRRYKNAEKISEKAEEITKKIRRFELSIDRHELQRDIQIAIYKEHKELCNVYHDVIVHFHFPSTNAFDWAIDNQQYCKGTGFVTFKDDYLEILI